MTQCPTKVSDAINAVTAAVRILAKDENNDYAGYKFAGIEKFLQNVSPICAECGLIISMSEEGFQFSNSADGKPWAIYSYEFTLGHKDGDVWDKPLKRTVAIQYLGPQTAGSAQSYALKAFMRSQFLISTGENDDADFTRPIDENDQRGIANAAEGVQNAQAGGSPYEGVFTVANAQGEVTGEFTESKQWGQAVKQALEDPAAWAANSGEIERVKQIIMSRDMTPQKKGAVKKWFADIESLNPAQQGA